MTGFARTIPATVTLISGFTPRTLPGCLDRLKPVRKSRCYLDFLEKFKIPLPAHPRRTQKVLDDKNRNLVIGRNHKRARNTRLGADQMIAPLSIEGESLSLENCGQRRIVNGPNRGHLSNARRLTIQRNKLRSLPQIALAPVSSFLQNPVQGSHVSAGFQKSLDRVPNILAGFVVGCAAA